MLPPFATKIDVTKVLWLVSLVCLSGGVVTIISINIAHIIIVNRWLLPPGPLDIDSSIWVLKIITHLFRRIRICIANLRQEDKAVGRRGVCMGGC